MRVTILLLWVVEVGNEMIVWIYRFRGSPLPEESLTRKLVQLPESCIDKKQILPLDGPTLGSYLFDNGVSSSTVDRVLDEMGELVRIAKWYQRAAIKPSEQETVAYLVIPVLRALGWSPQKMASQWNNIDIALFNRLPRIDHNLVVVVEAKKTDLSCLMAQNQAAQYAGRKDRDGCKRIIVTNGLRYAIYTKTRDNTFPTCPDAYISLTWMKASYPIMRCKGACEALLLMAPE